MDCFNGSLIIHLSGVASAEFLSAKKFNWEENFMERKAIMPGLLVLLIAGIFLTGQAQAQTSISGKMTMAYTEMDSLVVGDTEGHYMMLGKAQGSNANAEEGGFMDGADITDLLFSDLIMGNGSNEGYVIFKSGEDMAMGKWKGAVKTTMTEEGTPDVTFKGTWEYIKGAGKYKGITGSGTYEGHFTTMTEFIVNWEGEYTLK
jgi:hypothetical protein